MRFLLLIIGLTSCIAGAFFRKDTNRQMQSISCIISGVLLILAYLIFLISGIKSSLMISFFTITFVVVGVWGVIKLRDYQSISNNSTFRRNNILKWGIFSVIMIAPVLFGIYAAKLPTVTLENGVIKMGGSFGDDFKVSEIRTIDTVSVYPKVGLMHNGSGLFVSYIGNFDMVNEEKLAKLCIYRNKPPFIKIRMDDNRLLLLNFYNPGKTVNFYNQIKNTIRNCLNLIKKLFYAA